MAVTVGGNINIVGVTDKGLSELFKFKSAHEGKFNVNPSQIQPQGGPHQGKYLVPISWGTFEGMKSVVSLIEILDKE